MAITGRLCFSDDINPRPHIAELTRSVNIENGTVGYMGLGAMG